MSLVYRPARAENQAAADALVVASIDDLTVRHGFGPMAAASPSGFLLLSLEDDRAGLWVAEEGEEIVGFAWSWVCGDLWFLARLFVDPGRQGQGIGNALMERTMAHARKSGAVHKALINFYVQSRLAGPLYPARPFSQDADLLFQCGAQTCEASPAGRAFATDGSAATLEIWL